MITFLLKQETFEGPLDLLLSLIEKQELDITTISLAQVTDQYLERVRQLQRQELPEVTDFLVIAARLLLLKSRALLAEDAPAEDQVDDLATQLAEYKIYKELAGQLSERWDKQLVAFERGSSHYPGDLPLVTDGVSLASLEAAFSAVLQRLPAEAPRESATMEAELTLEECVDNVRQSVARRSVSFISLFAQLTSRLGMIVTFLAVLELFKQQYLTFSTTKNQLMVARA